MFRNAATYLSLSPRLHQLRHEGSLCGEKDTTLHAPRAFACPKAPA
jgi:hypothetical protein